MGRGRLLEVILATSLAAFMTLPAAGQSAEGMDAYIKGLPDAQRSRLIENYIYAGFAYDKFLKFPRPPAIYLSCAGSVCYPSQIHMLDELRWKAPSALGERTDDADKAQIEIYVASQSSSYEARDRLVDGKLHTDASYSGRYILPALPPLKSLPAPCWTATYFDFHTGTIAKSLIFIDSDASPRMQSFCMGFELVRAMGVVNTYPVILYRKLEADPDIDPTNWLAANAYLQGLPDIHPGDTMEKVHSVLKARYERE